MIQLDRAIFVVFLLGFGKAKLSNSGDHARMFWYVKVNDVELFPFMKHSGWCSLICEIFQKEVKVRCFGYCRKTSKWSDFHSSHPHLTYIRKKHNLILSSLTPPIDLKKSISENFLFTFALQVIPLQLADKSWHQPSSSWAFHTPSSSSPWPGKTWSGRVGSYISIVWESWWWSNL